MKSELEPSFFYRFESCEKLKSTPNDLIILKKNSQFNSLTSNEVLDLDG